MKSSHPERSSRDNIKQKQPEEESSSARLEEGASLSVSMSSVIMQSKCKPPRDAIKKRAIQLGRRGRITTIETLARNQTGIREMCGKRGEKKKTLAKVDETPSHALDVV